MDYPDKVLTHIRKHKETSIDTKTMNHPNRFWCAVNYLVELHVLTNMDIEPSNDWTILRIL